MLSNTCFVSGRATFRPRSRAGFTLTEIAIVLGIIGVVIAGVWAAGSSFGQQNRLNRASDELNIIRSNAVAFYSSQNASYAALNAAHALNAPPLAVPSTAGNDFCYYTPTFTPTAAHPDAGVFPLAMQWPRPPAATRYAFNAFDSNYTTSCGGTAGSAQVSLAKSAGGSPSLFVVRYTSVPVDLCPQLILRNSMPGVDTKLQEIAITGASGTTTYVPGTLTCTAGAVCNLPPSIVDAATGCGGTGVVTIDWYFRLGS